MENNPQQINNTTTATNAVILTAMYEVAFNRVPEVEAFHTETCEIDWIDWGADMPEYSNVSSCKGRVDSVKINVTYENEGKENMTSKFKAGDKVVAVRDHTYYIKISTPDSVGMKVNTINKGQEYTVSDVGSVCVVIEGCGGYAFQPVLFELVTPTFKNMKFRVSSPEHSKEIQEALFEIGYKWEGCHEQSKSQFDLTFIYTSNTGLITYGLFESTFVQDLSTEHILEITKSYKLIPVETPKPEIIEIDGKTYDKEAVLKRLAELDEVK